jgi:hypothetical protein
LEVVEDLVEALPLILEINGSLAKVVHLLLLLAVQALLVLKLLSRWVLSAKDFWELSLQPFHCNGVTLLHPLKSGLQLGNICMAEILQSIGRIARRYYTCDMNGKRKLLLRPSWSCSSTTSAFFSDSSFSCELMAWTRSSMTFL